MIPQTTTGLSLSLGMDKGSQVQILSARPKKPALASDNAEPEPALPLNLKALFPTYSRSIRASQRLIKVVVSGVAGPPVPVYFAGARLDEAFPLSVLQGTLGLGVGVLSYAKGLYLDIAADVDVVPDVEAFASGISDALDQRGTTTIE